MIKETKIIHSKKRQSKGTKYVPDVITGNSALKKEAIVQTIDEGNQLTLLATILMQVAEKVGLDTPEYTEAKQKFGSILNILNNGGE